MVRYFVPGRKIQAQQSKYDQFSLVRAIIIAMVVLQIEATSAGATLDEFKTKLRKYKRTPAASKEPIYEMLDTAGIQRDLPAYSFPELAEIAAHHTDFKIEVYEFLPNVDKCALVHKFNNTATKTIHLIHHEGKFETFKPTVANSGLKKCDMCRQSYTHQSRHRCPNMCPRCRRDQKDCKSTPDFSIVCDDCSYTFISQACFDDHLMIKANSTVCRQFKKCPGVCGADYKPQNLNGPHVCHATRYCSICIQHQDPKGHNCSYYPPTWKQILEKRKKQDKFTVVVYDLETVLLNDANNVLDFAHEQWPNMAAWSVMCEQCFDTTPGIPCNHPDSGYFLHEVGEDKNIVVNKLLDFLLKEPTLQNSIILAHNGSRFDQHFLLQLLTERPVKISTVARGLQIIQMKVAPREGSTCNELIFRDSYLYLPMKLANLPSAFGIVGQMKGYFCYLYNHPDHYSDNLPGLPAIDYYNPMEMKPDAHALFMIWYEAEKHKRFNFREQLVAYGVNDVLLLKLSIAAYMKSSLQMTGYNPIVQCATVASFSFFLLKHKHMKTGMIGYIPEMGFHGNDVQSELALKYLKWIEHTEGVDIQYFLRGGEYKEDFGGRSVKFDGIHTDPTTGNRVVTEVLGCCFHGHNTCFDPEKPSPFDASKTFGQLYAATMERLDLIRTKYEVRAIWECEIHEMLKSDRTMKIFFDSVRHKRRLQIRDSFRGGRTQCYYLKAEATEGREIEHLDVNSMYPAVLCKTPLPMGQPEPITVNILPIVLPLPYNGFYMVDIVGPRNGLRFPVIPYSHNGKLIFGLCRTCIEKSDNTACTHETDEERYMHVVVYQDELIAALENNYRVIKCYEVYHWPSDKWTLDLFRSFLLDFIKVKMESSGWPDYAIDDETKDAFIAKVLREEGIQLDKLRMLSNPGLRTISKLAINSSWGKFAEKSDKTELHIFDPHGSTVPEYMTSKKYNVKESMPLGNKWIFAVQLKKPFQEAPRYTNLAIASICTCIGRLWLWRALMRLGDRALYCDTDSVIMIAEKNKDNLEDIRGSQLGQWQSEIHKDFYISKFVSTGPKVYGYVMKHRSTGETRVICKARGITQDMNTNDTVNPAGLELLVEGLVTGDARSISTSRTQIVKSLGSVSTLVLTKRLNPVMDKVRYLQDYSTLPLGWLDATPVPSLGGPVQPAEPADADADMEDLASLADMIEL